MIIRLNIPRRYHWRIAASLVYAVVFLELYLRLIGCRWFLQPSCEYLSAPFKFSTSPLESEDKLDPSYYHVIKGQPVKLLSMNHDGVRAPERNGEPVGYLALGSSSTFSAEVDDNIAWPEQTAQDINRKLGRDVVWIGNAGRGGMNTVHNILQLRYLAPRLNLTGVILNPGLNDANYYSRHGCLPVLDESDSGNLKRSYIEAFPVPAIRRMIQMDEGKGWLKKTYTYQFAEEFKLQFIEPALRILGEKLFPSTTLAARHEAFLTSEDRDQVVAQTEIGYAGIFRQLVVEARQMGLDVIVVNCAPVQGDLMLEGINRAIARVCREENVPLFDVESHLADFKVEVPEKYKTPEQRQKYLANKRYIYHDGHHYNNKGSQWLANELANFMLAHCNTLRDNSRIAKSEPQSTSRLEAAP